jgi:hypothetical protein
LIDAAFVIDPGPEHHDVPTGEFLTPGVMIDAHDR